MVEMVTVLRWEECQKMVRVGECSKEVKLTDV